MASKVEIASYVAYMCGSLANLADKNSLATVKYLLDVAQLEASRCTENPEKANAERPKDTTLGDRLF